MIKEKEKNRQEATVAICAEVDFAIDEQEFYPFINFGGGQLMTSKAELAKVKESLKHGSYERADNNSVVLGNGFTLPPFVVLPSVVCACQIDNVEVVKKSAIFNCDKMQLCVEYVVCMKLFDKDNRPQCQEFRASFVKAIDRDDFEYLAPFPTDGNDLDILGGISLADFLSAEGACVNVTPDFDPDDCFVLNLGNLSVIFLLFPFDVLVKLFRTHNVVLPLVGGGARVERIPKVLDRCNSCFGFDVGVAAESCKK
ncbi:hypothetical protein V6C27_05005 [Peptococcaceae bacterium 1198_IL3148]